MHGCTGWPSFARPSGERSRRAAAALDFGNDPASDDIAVDYEHLAKNGVAFNAPLFGAAPSRFAYGRDPFGNVIELLEHAPQAPTGLRFED